MTAKMDRRLAAELVGTFTLVFIGPGAAAVNAWSNGAVTHVGVALAFGLVVMVLVYALGHISGGHFNPAVTFGLWVAGRFPLRTIVPYVLAQLSGGVLAALALRTILGAYVEAAATRPGIGSFEALLTEGLLTFFLMLTILAVSTDTPPNAAIGGLAIGAAVGFGALMGGPLTGASMNPARSFGPAVAGDVWFGHWIYWAGPFLGAAVGAGTHTYLRGRTAQLQVEKPEQLALQQRVAAIGGEDPSPISVGQRLTGRSPRRA